MPSPGRSWTRERGLGPGEEASYQREREHLGAGLDTQVFRIDPPSKVDWYDVDDPEVIAVHERLLPGRR